MLSTKVKSKDNKYSFLKSKYMDKTPVIVTSSFLKEKKYLVPDNFTFGQLLYYLRKRSKDSIKPSEAIYIYVHSGPIKHIPMTHELITKYENGDYVYVTVKKEPTFG